MNAAAGLAPEAAPPGSEAAPAAAGSGQPAPAPPPKARGPREAPADLLVLAAWEERCEALLRQTGRWPKGVRFTLTQRIENHALDVLEMLVEARYMPAVRPRLLREANLRLERMRFLLRLALAQGCSTVKAFESAMRGLDEVGRMLHGWRVAIGERAPRSAGSA